MGVHPSPSRSRHRGLVAAVAAVALIGAACASDDGGSAPPPVPAQPEAAPEVEVTVENWVPVYSDAGVLQPLPNGFPSKPIRVISRDAPGQRNYILTRNLMDGIGSLNLSPVGLSVVDRPRTPHSTFDSILEMQEDEDCRLGYCLTIVSVGGAATTLHAEPIQDITGHTIDDLVLIGAFELWPYIMVQRKDAPWGPTLAGMIEYGRANPGALVYTSNQVGSGNDIAAEWFLDQFGITVTKIPTAGNQESVNPIAAGESDFTLAQANIAQDNWEAGVVDITMVTGDSVPEPWANDPNVVTSVSLTDDPGFGLLLGWAVAPEVPELHRQWLFELFRAGSEAEIYATRADRIAGISMLQWEPAFTTEYARTYYDMTESIFRRLGLHHEQN